MDHPTPHLYLAAGRDAGVPDPVLRASLTQIATSEAHGAGPILSLRHLANLSGAPYLYLREIVQRRRDPYEDIARPKRTGGTRFISAPEPMLMDVQRLILHRALRNLDLHPASYAYQRRRSILGCAERHVGARWLVKFDLHDFFNQIVERDVYAVFLARGYSPLVSVELARICTRARLATNTGASKGRYRSITSYDVGVMGRVPQGAPTSGALSNAVATPLDHDMDALARTEGFVYTRYSDDMVLSTSGEFNRDLAIPLIREVERLVASHKFRLHRKKTRIVPPGARHIVLGLLVDDAGVRLTPEFRRRVEVHIRGVARFGLLAHARHRGFRSLLSFVHHVEGCLAFAMPVQPGWAHARREEWRAAIHDQGFPA